MPDWVWIIVVVLFLYEKWGKLRVFDVGRGLIHLEFSEPPSELDEVEAKKTFKASSNRKLVGR